MASPRPATWSVSACLRYRGGLEIRAAAENVVLPWWGHGGERLSFLLRLRRRLRLAVTSQCARAPPASADPDSKKEKKPRALKLLRFLRSRLALAPSALRRKKKPPPPRAEEDDLGPRAQPVPCFLNRALMRPAKTTATVLCFLAALAVAAVALRLVAGFMMPSRASSPSCTSWRCFLAKRLAKNFLGPPLQEWFSKTGLRLLEFLDPPAALCGWPGLPKLGLKWLCSSTCSRNLFI